MQETILIIYLIVSIALIGIILIQQGKGAEMGASFGAGAANTVFGAGGSGNVLTKTTTILAILFFAIALSISYFNAEPAITVDAVLDEGSVAAEETVQATSLEAELPVVEGGLASEVAPQEKSAIEAEVPVASEAVDTKAEEVKAAAEDKAAEKKDKETDN